MWSKNGPFSSCPSYQSVMGKRVCVMEKDGAGVGDGEPVTNMSDHSEPKQMKDSRLRRKKKV